MWLIDALVALDLVVLERRDAIGFLVCQFDTVVPPPDVLGRIVDKVKAGEYQRCGFSIQVEVQGCSS